MTPLDDQIVLTGMRAQSMVNPFGASPEELLAGILEQNDLLGSETRINDQSAQLLSKSFHQKRSLFKEATRLGNILVREGVISAKDLTEALEEQKRLTKPLGEVLVDLGYCTRLDIEEGLSSQKDARDNFARMEKAQQDAKGFWQKILPFGSDTGNDSGAS